MDDFEAILLFCLVYGSVKDLCRIFTDPSSLHKLELNNADLGLIMTGTAHNLIYIRNQLRKSRFYREEDYSKDD